MSASRRMINGFFVLAGTLGLMILVAALGFWLASRENARLIEQEIVGSAPLVSIDLRPEMYAELPAPVRRYFDFAFNGQTDVSLRAVSFRQTGQFLLPVGEFEAQGRQISRPASTIFAWIGTFRRFGLPLIETRDAYFGNRHDMRAKLFGWIKVMHTDYEEAEQIASLHSYMTLRYYGQAPLMPWALLPNESVTWEARDHRSAVLRITRPDLAGAYVVTFGEDGRIEEMASDRLLMEGNLTVQFEVGQKLDYRVVEGFMVPTRLDYQWTLADGTVSSHFRSEVRELTLIR